MEDQELLEGHIRRLRRSLRRFSNAGKTELEVWACRHFLQLLGESPSPDSVVPIADSAPDVRYHDASFEVKEITDPGRRRTDEYRAAIVRAEQATRFADVFEHYTPKDLTLEAILQHVEAELPGWQQHYEPKFRRSLDLLVYHNWIEHSVVSWHKPPIPSDIEQYGFRSISVMTNEWAWILWAANDAPSWLRERSAEICLDA